MNLSEVKKVLEQYGLEMYHRMPLSEAFSILNRNGYLLEDGADIGDDDTDDEDEGEDEGGNEPDESKLTDDQKKNIEIIKNKLEGIEDYTTYVKALSSMKPEQAKLLKELVGDGEYAKAVKVSTVSIPVSTLHPTQQEIDVQNSLFFPLNKNPDGILPILRGTDDIVINKSPIIIYKYKDTYYIIDGHHRWSQVFMLNPNATMKAILYSSPENTDETPVEMLRDFQLVIKATKGEVKVATADKKYNVYTMTEQAIKDYIDTNITEKAIAQFQKYKDGIQKKGIVNYITKNAMTLKEKNGPAKGAPERGVMPQTDEESLDVAKKGMTDI